MRNLFLFLGFYILLPGCGQVGNRNEHSETAYHDSTIREEQGDMPPLPQIDTLVVTGLVKEVDDMGYPFFYLSLNQGDTSLVFTFNREQINLDHDDSWNLSGKSVEIHYTAQLEPLLLDIHYQGGSVLGDDSPELDTTWLSITGKLEGATEATPGDLPGEISIKNTEEAVSFDFFVSDEVVQANNQEVTGYYYFKKVNHIHQLRVLDDQR
ncbi:MAG: hypothetical protein JJ975_13670 [Bacteroidia bacterium]|nr:hypothetical protein [Bacteroidia bacterium]